MAVAKIASFKGGDLKLRVSNATQNLLKKIPNADKIYIEQMMYASYCSSLRDDKTISESTKARLLKEYNDDVRRSLNTKSHDNTSKMSHEKKKKANISPRGLMSK